MIRAGLIVSAIAVVLMDGIAIWAGQLLPAENIPVHWNANGVADRFADRQEAMLMLWLLPGSALFGALVFCLLPQIEPMRDNLYKSRKAYNAVWISTMILFLCIHAGIAYMMVSASSAESLSNEFVRLVIAGTGILFIVLGNYLPKTRQNWFLGIRTPWTLSRTLCNRSRTLCNIPRTLWGKFQNAMETNPDALETIYNALECLQTALECIYTDLGTSQRALATI